MPKLNSLEELRQLKQQAQQQLKVRGDTGIRITVGMGTCGIAAGAREVMNAILEELESRGIQANVATVGCVGMCSQEPLVDIEMAGAPRITYGRITPEMVPALIAEHLLRGQAVKDWVVARAPGV